MPEALAKMTPKQRLLLYWGISGVSTILLLSLFFFLLYKPQLEALQAKKNELQQLQAQLVKARNTEREVAKAKAAIQKKERELKKLELALPKEEYVPTLLEQIENLASRTNTQVASLAPGQVTPAQPLPDFGSTSAPPPPPNPNQKQNPITYQQLTIGIPFQGGYASLLTFLRELAKLPIVVVVSSVSITKGSGVDPTDGSPMLSANLPAVVYLLPKTDQATSSG